jgi:hypothetical protein
MKIVISPAKSLNLGSEKRAVGSAFSKFSDLAGDITIFIAVFYRISKLRIVFLFFYIDNRYLYLLQLLNNN